MHKNMIRGYGGARVDRYDADYPLDETVLGLIYGQTQPAHPLLDDSQTQALYVVSNGEH